MWRKFAGRTSKAWNFCRILYKSNNNLNMPNKLSLLLKKSWNRGVRVDFKVNLSETSVQVHIAVCIGKSPGAGGKKCFRLGRYRKMSVIGCITRAWREQFFLLLFLFRYVNKNLRCVRVFFGVDTSGNVYWAPQIWSRIWR